MICPVGSVVHLLNNWGQVWIHCRFAAPFFSLRQVDYLQQANRDLEKQLKDSIEQRAEATKLANELEARNAELLLELKDITRMSKRQEEDSQRDNIVIRSELAETKVCKKEIRGVSGLSVLTKFATFPPHFLVPLQSTLALLAPR